MKRLLLVPIFLLCYQATTAQVVSDSGDLVIEVNSIKNNMPDSGTNVYAAPTASQASTWGNLLNLLLEKNYSTAADTAATISYEVVEYKDTVGTDVTYYMLRATGSNYWGTYIYNPNFTRDLVIQAPHSYNDYNTHREGVYIFRVSGAMIFMMNGTHRCNESNLSACDGTTSVCNAGVDQAFNVSDMAHVDNSIFHYTTDSLLNKYSSTYFIQLHGFSKKASDPYVIMSNGTQDTPAVDYMGNLQTNLFNEDNTLTFKVAHFDTTWTRLRGFTNTQGRMINNSSDPCDQNPDSSTGRFFHLEQEKSKLRNDEAGWTKMANAITATFPLTALPIELNYFDVTLQADNRVLATWQTASEYNNEFFTIERSQDGHNWTKAAIVYGAGNSTYTINYQYIDKPTESGYIYYRLKQTDFDGKYEYSKIRQVYIERHLVVYPNPAQNEVNIEIDELEPTSVSFINSLGKAISLSYEVEAGKILVNTSTLANGIYTLVVTYGNEKLYHKLIIGG